MADVFQADETFCVSQFFSDGTNEQVTKTPVSGEEAVARAKLLTDSIGARIGTTQRVVITDSSDLIVFEWIHGQGVVFPPRPQTQG